jgi:hypothetical protein
VEKNGYRVVKGLDNYNHYFGGDSWETPLCPNCKVSMHLIINFDLKDKRLEELGSGDLNSIPLVSCLNCSSFWSPQIFWIDANKKEISLIEQSDEEKWVANIEDRLPYPLPFSEMKLVELQDTDVQGDDDSDPAFEAFGSEYICRILGNPLFATEYIHKECAYCNEELLYVATICSEDYYSKGLVHETFSFNFGESFLYFYLCRNCSTVETEMQSM